MTTAKSRRRYWLAGILAVLLVAAGGAYFWWPVHRLVIPTIPTNGLDPEVVAALADARDRVQHQPESADAWGHYGLVAFAHGKYVECRPLFERAEQLDPENYRWPYYRGLAWKFERPDECVTALQQALNLNPRSPAVKMRLAETLLEIDRLDEANKLFDELLAARMGNPRVHLGQGQILVRRGRWSEALPPLQAATAHPTSQKTAFTALAEAYAHLNRPEDAAAARTKADAFPPDILWPDPLLNEMEKVHTGLNPRLDRAEALFKNQHADEALAQLRGIIRDHPESEDAQLRLADWYFRLNDPEAAEPALRAALAINPSLATGHFMLAGVYMHRKDYAAAEDSYQKALAANPNFGQAHYNLGQCRLKRGNPAGAEKAFRDAVRTRPDLALAQLALGELLLKAGNREEALPYLENAVRLAPLNADAKARLDEARKK
jgi:tetratricopeptide (TPR) repeat protein